VTGDPRLDSGARQRLPHLRVETLVCLFVAAVVFAPYWVDSVLPFHDSLFKYQFFHFAYSQVLASGEIPLWVPYGTYGMASGIFQLMTLTPASYLVGAAGIASGASNTLLLFKCTMFLEVALYAMGLLLLARSIYEHFLSRWMVVLGGLLSLSWLVQPHFNFLAFYLYPYILLFLFEFLRSSNPGKLWLAVFIVLVSLIGTAPYLAPLHLLVLTVVGVVAIVAGARPSLEPNWRQWLLRWEAGLAASLAVILVMMAWLSIDEILSIGDGRIPESNRVPLDAFLEYGRKSMATVLSGYLSGTATHGDNTYYIGLLPLVLVMLGLLRLRNPYFLGVAAAALSLAWLAVGGYFSTLVYFFPGMWLFRHIGLTFGLSGLLLIIASGWVIDELLTRASTPARSQSGPFRHQRLVVFTVIALLALDVAANWRQNDGAPFPIFQTAFLFLAPLRLAAYFGAIAAEWMRRRHPPGPGAGAGRVFMPLLAAYLFDIGSFQAAVFLTLPRFEPAFSADAFMADTMPYRAVRYEERSDDSAAEWKLALPKSRTTLIDAGYGNSALYSFTYTFLGVDPCYPRLRTDLLQRGVHAALVTRGGRPRQRPRDDFLPEGDPGFRAALGCGRSKVALIGDFVGADSGAHARILLKSSLDPLARPVLEIGHGAERSGDASAEVSGEVRVTGFSANRITLEVTNPGSRSIWLYYADAFHPHWQARVDGVGTPVVRANVGFKAVSVPPGSHSVSLTFGEGVRQIVSWLLAAMGGAACLAGLIAAAAMATRRDGARAHQESFW